ncbi:hypothetical protein GW17_00055045 [Ensete ventricosum]|nr:hypothetical protein GW17_00055045 [Ensete ventricosum]
MGSNHTVHEVVSAPGINEDGDRLLLEETSNLHRLQTMRWDLVGSSLGTRREIAGKKTGGLAARLPEVVGVCGRFDLHPKKISSGCRYASRRRT